MKNSIAQTNKYLRDPIKRREAVRRASIASTAVEGVHIDGRKVIVKKQLHKVARQPK